MAQYNFLNESVNTDQAGNVTSVTKNTTTPALANNGDSIIRWKPGVTNQDTINDLNTYNTQVLGKAATTPITIDQLTPTTAITVPTANDTTSSANSLVSAATTSQKTLNDYIKEATPQKTALDNTYESVLASIANLTAQDTGKAKTLAQAKIDTGYSKLSGQLAELNSQIEIGNAAYQQIQTKLENQKASLEANSQGVASPILNAQQNALTRQANSELALKASEIAMYSARAQAVSGQMTTALQIANDAVDAKYAPIEDELAVKKAQLAAIEPLLTKQEKILSTALERQYNDEQAKLEEDKANQKSIQEIILTATSNDAPSDLIDAASKATTAVEAAKILGKYSGDYLKNELLKEQIKTEKAQQSKIYNDIKETTAATTTEQGSKYAGVLNTILGSDKFTKSQIATITNAINNGQDPFTVIKNQAKNIMGQTNATSLDKYETAKAQIEDIQSLLSDYYKNGGTTGLFKGNYEKVVNNLGQVSDPKLVQIATNISAALQIYRNAVSGTAYSVQEGKDIASIFPGINKSQGLNEAVLSGRLKAFDTTIDATYKNTLGDVYYELKKLQNDSASSQNNPFAQSLGNNSSSNYINGSSIIGGVNTNGTFNFVIP